MHNFQKKVANYLVSTEVSLFSCTKLDKKRRVTFSLFNDVCLHIHRSTMNLNNNLKNQLI